MGLPKQNNSAINEHLWINSKSHGDHEGTTCKAEKYTHLHIHAAMHTHTRTHTLPQHTYTKYTHIVIQLNI